MRKWDAKCSGWQPAVSLDDISKYKVPRKPVVAEALLFVEMCCGLSGDNGTALYVMPGRSVVHAWTGGSQQRDRCEEHAVGEVNPIQ